jgi:hypothetical protein
MEKQQKFEALPIQEIQVTSKDEMDTSQNEDLRRETSFLSDPTSEKPPVTEFSAAQPYHGASDATAVFHSNTEFAT